MGFFFRNGGSICILHFQLVYTIGIRRNEYGPEVVEGLKKLGADFVTTNRGGLITFHGPGQLVAYPILNLNKLVSKRCQFKSQREKCLVGMRWYVNMLEQVLIQSKFVSL